MDESATSIIPKRSTTWTGCLKTSGFCYSPAALATNEGNKMAALTTGDTAPDFELPRDGGGTFRLSALRGKPVVLFFYPKDDTSGCTAEAIDFSTRKNDFDALGVEIAGLSPDSPKKHDNFKKKHGLTVALISDQEKTVLDAYGIWVEKSMYGRKYMGVERTTVLIGADGRIVAIWPKVKVPGHVDAVLEATRKHVTDHVPS